MKVRAKKRGFFGGVYYTPGDGKEFECDSKAFSDVWMEKVDGRKKSSVVKPSANEYVPLEIHSLMNKEYDNG